MARIFRVMTVCDGRPAIGPNARALGVRIPDDIVVDENEKVQPATGGMSVAPSWRQLPSHRIPNRLRRNGMEDARGKDGDACWRMGEGEFSDGLLRGQLLLRVHRPAHGTVEPAETMAHADYVRELISTAPLWKIDED